MDRKNIGDLMNTAWKKGLLIPGFNIPYLPMMEPVVNALETTNSFGLIMVARLEWIKFEAKGLKEIRNEYEKVKNERHTRLHLDHVPVIDEDLKRVDFIHDIKSALDLGYESVMIDGSRLSLEENIKTTRQIVEIAGKYKVPVEAELGAIPGHEEGPLPPYDELYRSGKGFTDVQETGIFVRETGTDWLSVAIGNIHGPISKVQRSKEKTAARLNTNHLKKLQTAANIPLVLHGGTGIRKENLMEAMKMGIAKINIATAIRKPYEQAENIHEGQQAVFDTVVDIIKNFLEIENISKILYPDNKS